MRQFLRSDVQVNLLPSTQTLQKLPFYFIPLLSSAILGLYGSAGLFH